MGGSPFFPPWPRPRSGAPPPIGLELPPLLGEEDEGFLPRIGIATRSYSPKAIGQAGLPPGKDLTIETQAPSQYAGATQETSTVPLVTPVEEGADPENFRGHYQKSYQTPQEVSLGDWAKEVQSREGPPKLAANSSVRTYTNKDLDEVVRENRGSVMQVHSSSTTDQDDLDVGRREAREGAEFAAGQSRLDAIVQDPTGEKAKETAYQRSLGVARAGGEARTRQDRSTVMLDIADSEYEAALGSIDGAVQAGKITPQQAEAQKQSLLLVHAQRIIAIRSAARQKRQRTNPEEMLLTPDDELLD